MDTRTHRARIIGPVSFVADSGRQQNIPFGPCLVECAGERFIDIIWGMFGERSAALPVEEVEAAQDQGRLMLLD